uniref:Selenoprotein M n=1 Tax=Gopherus evgoodei TaxID=1825980 RepID=A0A8C5EYC8_9SAUR
MAEPPEGGECCCSLGWGHRDQAPPPPLGCHTGDRGTPLASSLGPSSPRRCLCRGQALTVLCQTPLHNLVMKHLPGADPELVLLSFRYEELERIPLSDMSREEINQLVQELGFYRKEAPDALVPEKFQLAPARPLPILQAKEQAPPFSTPGLGLRQPSRCCIS